jgi:endonuclease YncB( thermonuclease family)
VLLLGAAYVDVAGGAGTTAPVIGAAPLNTGCGFAAGAPLASPSLRRISAKRRSRSALQRSASARAIMSPGASLGMGFHGSQDSAWPGSADEHRTATTDHRHADCIAFVPIAVSFKTAPLRPDESLYARLLMAIIPKMLCLIPPQVRGCRRPFLAGAFVASAFFFGTGPVGAETLQGHVVGVHDGDSITLLDAEKRQHKVRLDGIDAPELGQPFGAAAKRNLSGLAFDREAIATCSKTDRYRRQVCMVTVDGADVGRAQLRDGFAWFFRRYAAELPPDRRTDYEGAEADASSARRGLWSTDAPVPPWEWRAAKSISGARQ